MAPPAPSIARRAAAFIESSTRPVVVPSTALVRPPFRGSFRPRSRAAASVLATPLRRPSRAAAIDCPPSAAPVCHIIRRIGALTRKSLVTELRHREGRVPDRRGSVGSFSRTARSFVALLRQARARSARVLRAAHLRRARSPPISRPRRSPRRSPGAPASSNPGPGSAAAWLYTIGRRQLNRFIKSQPRRVALARTASASPSLPVAADALERAEDLIDLEAVRAPGRERPRAAQEATCARRSRCASINGRPYAEAARLTGCSEQVARASASAAPSSSSPNDLDDPRRRQ